MYADDSTMTETGSTVEEIGQKLTASCTRVSEWMSSNKLKLNADKTHLLMLGTQERLRNTGQLDVYMDGLVLEESLEKCEELLGVDIEANLKWHSQISKLMSKLKTRLVGLNKLKFLAPFKTRNTITIGIFNSVLVYCLPLFGGCDKGEIQDLQVLQNKAARIVTHKPSRSSRKDLYDQLSWMSVNQLIVYHTLLLVFKIRQSGEPEYLASFLNDDSRTGRVIIPNTKLGLAQKSFCFRGSSDFNLLPLNLRSSKKIGHFKHGVKRWVMENTLIFLE